MTAILAARINYNHHVARHGCGHTCQKAHELWQAYMAAIDAR